MRVNFVLINFDGSPRIVYIDLLKILFKFFKFSQILKENLFHLYFIKKK